MPRKLKPYPVEKFHHRSSGLTIQIVLNRNTKLFEADIKGIVVSASTAGGCKELALRKAGEEIRYNWRRIIVVTTQGIYHNQEARIEISFGEYEVSPVGDAKGVWYRKIPNSTDPDKFSIQVYYGSKESDAEAGIFVLPWSEGAMTALREIEAGVVVIRHKIYDLLSGDNPAQKLEGMTRTWDLLTSGSKIEGEQKP